jgi:hypothetical protein
MIGTSFDHFYSLATCIFCTPFVLMDTILVSRHLVRFRISILKVTYCCCCCVLDHLKQQGFLKFVL